MSLRQRLIAVSVLLTALLGALCTVSPAQATSDVPQVQTAKVMPGGTCEKNVTASDYEQVKSGNQELVFELWMLDGGTRFCWQAHDSASRSGYWTIQIRKTNATTGKEKISDQAAISKVMSVQGRHKYNSNKIITVEVWQQLKNGEVNYVIVNLSAPSA